MNEPPQLTEREQALRASVIRHCKWIRTYDTNYAKAAYQHYRNELPWLNLPPPSTPSK